MAKVTNRKVIKVSKFSLSIERLYSVYLRSILKGFWKYSSEYLIQELKSNRDFGTMVPDTFIARLTYKVVDDIISKSLSKTLKEFHTSIPSIGVIQKLSEFRESSILGIEENIKTVYSKRKEQLQSFRDSSLFTGNNSEVFLEKYRTPKFKFTNNMSRTDINNLNRDLAITQAKSLGLGEGVWSTSGDERVRESHRKLNGRVFSFNDLPKEYNDYNCRCVILPVIK